MCVCVCVCLCVCVCVCVPVCAGTVFYGRSQAEMVLRNNPTSGQGNIRHSTPAVGEQEIRDVSQGQLLLH